MNSKLKSLKISIILSAIALRISFFNLVISIVFHHNIGTSIIFLLCMTSILCDSIEEYFRFKKKALKGPEFIPFMPIP